MSATDTDSTLYEANPKMFRGHPLGFVLSLLLVPVAGLGLLILLVWWLTCKQTHIALDRNHTRVEKGLLSKSRIELRHTSVRTVHVYQSLGQRIFGVGKVSIFTAGDKPEVSMDGIPDPQRVREIINEYGQP